MVEAFCQGGQHGRIQRSHEQRKMIEMVKLPPESISHGGNSIYFTASESQTHPSVPMSPHYKY